MEALHFDGADNIIDMFQKLCDDLQKAPVSGESEKSEKKETTEASSEPSSANVDLIRLYTFKALDNVIAAAHGLNGFYQGENTLYKDESALYQLILHQSSCSAEDFNRVCNILSEYGDGRSFSLAGEAI